MQLAEEQTSNIVAWKHQFQNGRFNWMITHLYLKNGVVSPNIQI